MLELPGAPDGALTLVEVAVDAPAGPGPRTYTYAVPAALGAIEAGEAVLVPFGRGGRQAIGVVVGPGATVGGGAELKPIAARVRSDGPLLPHAVAAAWRPRSPTATSRRSRRPSGRCSRPGCWSASSWWSR